MLISSFFHMQPKSHSDAAADATTADDGADAAEAASHARWDKASEDVGEFKLVGITKVTLEDGDFVE